MDYQLNQTKHVQKSVFRYNFFLFWGMVLCLLAALINLIIFPAKQKITKETDISSISGQKAKLQKGVFEYENTGIAIKLSKDIDGYQFIQHASGELRIYTAEINGSGVLILSKKDISDRRIIVKAIDIKDSAGIDLTGLSAEAAADLNGVCILIEQKNQLSILLFIAAGSFLFVLIALFPIRIIQLMKLQKKDPDSFMEYYKNMGGK